MKFLCTFCSNEEIRIFMCLFEAQVLECMKITMHFYTAVIFTYFSTRHISEYLKLSVNFYAVKLKCMTTQVLYRTVMHERRTMTKEMGNRH